MDFNWIEEAQKKSDHEKDILSFEEYEQILFNNPRKECRPTYRYLLDMIDFYGKNEKGEYNIFLEEGQESQAVYGQSGPQDQIYQNLKNFEEEGFNNKFILLVGPNGSSKSSLVKQIMKSAETYSQTPEGSLYTFSWVFPINSFVKGTLGLKTTQTSQPLDSFAHLEDQDITAILASELKDHPILLVPLESRRKLIDALFEDSPKELLKIQKSYLYNGDLSKRNHMIYDALLKNYKGDHKEVLRHIRIERFTISKRYSTAAVTIEPQLHVDARLQQITMDKRLASLPPGLQSLNLFSMQGEVVLANRGILEYSDLLKRPLDTYKYLLMTMETKSINMQGILTDLDIFFVGTSNEVHLAAFRQHPDFNSFKGRFNFVKVPYLTDYLEETKIYKDQIESLGHKSCFAPNALEALCLFGVMTRIRLPQVKNYQNKKLANLAVSLNPLEKVLLYSSGTPPERLSSEAAQLLEQSIGQIKTEFKNDGLYEGKFGASPRDIKKFIYKISQKNEHITFIEVLEFLQTILTRKNDFDFLNMTPQNEYHHVARFISHIKEHSLNSFEQQLRESLGIIDSRSYDIYIEKYIQSINAMIKGEKIKNSITGKFENVDDYFIKEFETSVKLQEDPKVFRSHLISKLGAYSLDNPGKDIDYTAVFPELMNRLKESFRSEQKKVINKVAQNLVFFKPDKDNEIQCDNQNLSEDGKIQIDNILNNLETKFGYHRVAGLNLINYLIKERY
jgi:serine protein kinase